MFLKVKYGRSLPGESTHTPTSPAQTEFFFLRVLVSYEPCTWNILTLCVWGWAGFLGLTSCPFLRSKAESAPERKEPVSFHLEHRIDVWSALITGLMTQVFCMRTHQVIVNCCLSKYRLCCCGCFSSYHMRAHLIAVVKNTKVQLLKYSS